MSLWQILVERNEELTGKRATDAEIAMMKAKLPEGLLSESFEQVLRSFGLAGKQFEISEQEDLSRFGVSLYWLSPSQILSEALEAYPGRLASFAGFLPIGACAFGSGDPYFLDLRQQASDPPLVRIPHELARVQPFDCAGIDLITRSLSKFPSVCTIR